MENARLRRAVVWVALLNLAYFGVEFTVARGIGSVSLFADSIDFLEDAAVNLLILLALGWSARRRALVGTALAAILLAPGLATLWTAWGKLVSPVAPEALPLTLAGAGALAVNLFCAGLLARFRNASGSLTRAAFLSARNDAIANVAIVGAGLATRPLRSPWPDLVVGLGIFLMNLDAAREVWEAAREEHAGAAGAGCDREHAHDHDHDCDHSQDRDRDRDRDRDHAHAHAHAHAHDRGREPRP